MKLARYLTRNMLKTGFSVDVNFIKIRDKGKWIRHCLWMYLVIGFCLPNCKYFIILYVLPKTTKVENSKVSELMEYVFPHATLLCVSICILSCHILSFFLINVFCLFSCKRKKNCFAYYQCIYFIRTDISHRHRFSAHVHMYYTKKNMKNASRSYCLKAININ